MGTNQQAAEQDSAIAELPRIEDDFIQRFLQGRENLIEEEKKQRHDYVFKSKMSPIAAEASRIMSLIRRKELREVWTNDFEEELAEKNGGNLYPGMMFTLARDRMEKTVLWKIIENMPKGALLHAHLDAMMDTEFLIDQVFAQPGMHIVASEPLVSKQALEKAPVQFRFSASSTASGASVWDSSYKADTPVPVLAAAQSFPEGGEVAFRKWLVTRCTITAAESLCHHHGGNAIWRKFTSCFGIIDSVVLYEPIFRAAIQRLLRQLSEDGIRYVDFRHGFRYPFQLEGQEVGQEGFAGFFQAFDEEIERFKTTEAGRGFYGARMIYTVLRFLPDDELLFGLKECIRLKTIYPHLIAGVDFVGQEDRGRPLTELLPLIFWFRKRCVEEGVEIPFFFHAGETLGDGDEVDNNLFTAILLGTRRIGHGYSIYKHPLLVEMVKDKKILLESCPISNEILRLTSSILSHPLPALLARGVPISLNNDDPAILGHGKNGLTHDFWQTYIAFENLGLEGLATMAENSLKWSCFEDQKTSEWLRDITLAEDGTGTKAQRLKDWRVDFEDFCAWIIKEYALTVDDEEDEE
ncbi:MAG: hypothetical protein Q9227_000530 [Pyrenula ochraceoflavens]